MMSKIRQPACEPPPTPPPPSSPIPGRVRAVAQLRSVSVPDIVRDIAGNNPLQQIADFGSHYMPDGVLAPDASESAQKKLLNIVLI